MTDDEGKIPEIVQPYLIKDGYRMFTARTGSGALPVLENHAVSMSLLDLMLPDLPGEGSAKGAGSHPH